jgi:hypothetical protein
MRWHIDQYHRILVQADAASAVLQYALGQGDIGASLGLVGGRVRHVSLQHGLDVPRGSLCAAQRRRHPPRVGPCCTTQPNGVLLLTRLCALSG